MELFLKGSVAFGSTIVALFFLRFWRDTRDRLFLMFSACFFLLGVTRLGLALSDELSESQTQWYWLRCIAFLLILAAIIDKNRRR